MLDYESTRRPAREEEMNRERKGQRMAERMTNDLFGLVHTVTYIHVAKQFFARLVARRHDPTTLKTLFLDITARLDPDTGRRRLEAPDPFNTLFLHYKFHQIGIEHRMLNRPCNKMCSGTSGFN